ncbi:MAG: hypothetical protein R2793_04760 [Flavobacteriaceae bacterium]
MKKYEVQIILFIFLLISPIAHSQALTDSLFVDALIIENENVTTSQGNYLIDIPLLNESVKGLTFASLVYINASSTLPTPFLLEQIQREMSRFSKANVIVITPDWEYYNRVAKEAESMEGCIEPATTQIYYQLTKKNNKITLDSLRISGAQPKITMAPKPKGEMPLSYYQREYGSSCCPRDPAWDGKEAMDQKIGLFSSSYRKDILPTCTVLLGKEGEQKMLYALANLSQKEKLEFLIHMQDTTDNPQKKRVYAPIRLEKLNCYK